MSDRLTDLIDDTARELGESLSDGVDGELAAIGACRLALLRVAHAVYREPCAGCAALREALRDCFSLLPPDRVRLVRAASMDEIRKAIPLAPSQPDGVKP